jgi:protein-arginine kinase activator protein McsA
MSRYYECQKCGLAVQGFEASRSVGDRCVSGDHDWVECLDDDVYEFEGFEGCEECGMFLAEYQYNGKLYCASCLPALPK